MPLNSGLQFHSRVNDEHKVGLDWLVSLGSEEEDASPSSYVQLFKSLEGDLLTGFLVAIIHPILQLCSAYAPLWSGKGKETTMNLYN